jgi:hypothetical protein
VSPADWAIAAGAVALIAVINWFFLGNKRGRVAKTSAK